MNVEMTEVLLVFGFSWVLVGCFLGLIQGVKHTQHHATLDQYAKSDDLLAYHQELISFKQKTTAHTHTMLFPVVVILIALSMPLNGYAGDHPAILVIGLIVATVIWTIGGVLNLKPLKGIGDLLLIVSIMVTIEGLAKGL
ncbi:MAG: hypothetical protein DRR42_18310 [Gammaproteobacteria bacterium]|nr:MAG: hypothetical protein DRR42_18310 [Gammaproteobacteria bacterium]